MTYYSFQPSALHKPADVWAAEMLTFHQVRDEARDAARQYAAAHHAASSHEARQVTR